MGGDAVGFPLYYDNDSAAAPFAEDAQITSLFYPNIDVIAPPGTAQAVSVAIVKLELVDDERVAPEDSVPWVIEGTTTMSNVVATAVGTEEAKTLDDQSPEKIFYLVVFNPSEDSGNTTSFCVTSNDRQIPLTQIKVESVADFRGIKVGLESTKSVDLP